MTAVTGQDMNLVNLEAKLAELQAGNGDNRHIWYLCSDFGDTARWMAKRRDRPVSAPHRVNSPELGEWLGAQPIPEWLADLLGPAKLEAMTELRSRQSNAGGV
jgi:hypothetical protein